MKLKLLHSNRARKTVVAASLGLSLLHSALSAPLWMEGGHAARISGVACSPDGAMIASASEDGTVKLWSTNGTLLRTLDTQPFPATAIAWSPDGAKIAAGTYYGGFASGTVPYYGYLDPGLGLTYLWQAPNGWTATNVSLVRVTTNRYGKISALAFSADSAWLASGCAAGSNIVNSVADGSVVTTRPAYNTSVGPAAVTSVAFSSLGLMASGCEDRMIRVYNSSWSQVWSSTSAHSSNVTAVAFSPDGSLLATASLDQTIRVWSTTSWASLQTLTGHTNGIASVAFSPDGQKIVSGSVDGTVKIWNWSSGACLLTIATHALPVTATVFSPDGASVISGSDDDTVRVWSAADGSAVCTLGGQKDYIGSVAISPDGTLCASAGGDQTIQVRNAINGSLVRTLSGHTGYVNAIVFAPDSAVLASSGGPLDPTIKLWRLSDGAVVRTIFASANGTTALAFSPDGTMLASGGDCTEQCIRLWNAGDGDLVRTLAGHTNGVTALAFSPDGNLLASGGRRFDNVVKIWSVTNGALTRSLSGHAWNIESVAFAPDGASVASGSSGANSLRVWRLSDGSPRTFGSGTNPVFAVAFSPDGATLASVDQNTVRFWDVAAGTLSETVTQETVRASSVAYSPNGNLFLCGREDGTVTMSTNSRGALGQPPLTFTSFQVETNGVTTISASAQPWTHYVLWSSTNLTDWSYLTSAVSSTNVLTIAGPSVSNAPAGFYRATTPP
jgi:WD40 repeat protein